MLERQIRCRGWSLAALVLCVLGSVSTPMTVLEARGRTQAELAQESPFPGGETLTVPQSAMKEVKDALIRLPYAALLGATLALRPRKKTLGRRSVAVVQTQVMLAVVGAVIMLVVGNSLSRAFGIVGAAGLVKYRSTIDDPKEAVVMLCALGAGLAAGVGLYILAPFATVFMAAVLWTVEYFEPDAKKFFDLTITTEDASEFRPSVEGVLHGLGLGYELLSENGEEISYSVSAPLDVRTRDISDTLKILSPNDMEVEWKERKKGRL